MDIGRRRQEQGTRQGSGVSIGGANTGAIQNVVGQNISNVHQSASVQGGAVDIDAVRDLLAAFRLDVDRHEAVLRDVVVPLRAMSDTVDTSLAAPDRQVGTLRRIAQALPAMVAGTVVEQGGEALAHAIGSLLN